MSLAAAAWTHPAPAASRFLDSIFCINLEGIPIVNPANATQRALATSWLRPTNQALLALTEETPNALALRHDPGMLLHIVRTMRHPNSAHALLFSPAILAQPNICESAATLLETSQNTHAIPDSIVHRMGREWANIAEQIAERTGTCSPDAAWAAGLLAPLGWYALQQADADRPEGIAAIELTRRLATRWRLPRWLASTIGYLDLPWDAAEALGADAELFRIVRTAETVLRARHYEYQPFLGPDDWHDDELSPIAEQVPEGHPPIAEEESIEPKILARLLHVTARARQRSGQQLVQELEKTVDTLTDELTQIHREFDRKLRDAKLNAMAEFTAGASHEINNPLAGIAGNVQLLQGRETDPETRKALAAIRRQTKRIHDILYSARQFARPPAPNFASIDVAEMLRASAREFETVVGLLGGVELKLELPEVHCSIRGDELQLRQALQHILRNALEASGTEATIVLTARIQQDLCEIIVEDSGRGPDPAIVPHLFDPFFSGRSAGRGRGLGLSVAWRLVQQNGGDVSYAPSPNHPSRFVLRLPLMESLQHRLSA